MAIKKRVYNKYISIRGEHSRGRAGENPAELPGQTPVGAAPRIYLL